MMVVVRNELPYHREAIKKDIVGAAHLLIRIAVHTADNELSDHREAIKEAIAQAAQLLVRLAVRTADTIREHPDHSARTTLADRITVAQDTLLIQPTVRAIQDGRHGPTAIIPRLTTPRAGAVQAGAMAMDMLLRNMLKTGMTMAQALVRLVAIVVDTD